MTARTVSPPGFPHGTSLLRLLFGDEPGDRASDGHVRAVLIQLADMVRTHGPSGTASDPRVVGCLTAAADELLDPLQPPFALPAGVGGGLDGATRLDVADSVQLVRELLLDRTRRGGVREVLARGRAARELAEALHLLGRAIGSPAPDAAGDVPDDTDPVSPLAQQDGAGACTCGAGR